MAPFGFLGRCRVVLLRVAFRHSGSHGVPSGGPCRGLKHYKNNGFALFGWEEGWPKGGPGSVQEGLSWARESDQKCLRRVQVENANILQK